MVMIGQSRTYYQVDFPFNISRPYRNIRSIYNFTGTVQRSKTLVKSAIIGNNTSGAITGSKYPAIHELCSIIFYGLQGRYMNQDRA